MCRVGCHRSCPVDQVRRWKTMNAGQYRSRLRGTRRSACCWQSRDLGWTVGGLSSENATRILPGFPRTAPITMTSTLEAHKATVGVRNHFPGAVPQVYSGPRCRCRSSEEIVTSRRKDPRRSTPTVHPDGPPRRSTPTVHPRRFPSDAPRQLLSLPLRAASFFAPRLMPGFSASSSSSRTRRPWV
jgi:hypothetical protein